MPLCSAYPGPLSVLVMDNAKIHHGNAILELADQFGIVANLCVLTHLTSSICAGVRIEYLPLYSPDLNPIEEAFRKSNILFVAIMNTTTQLQVTEFFLICMR